MVTDGIAPALAGLALGFRTDSARLKAVERELSETLRIARNFGLVHGSDGAWNAGWHGHWDSVEKTIGAIISLVHEIDQSVEEYDLDRMGTALAAWAAFEFEDARMLETLTFIHKQASGLDAAGREDWNSIARLLDAQLATIHARAQGLRVKLELLKTHSKTDVEELVRKILGNLPDRAPSIPMDADIVDTEYRVAAEELEREKHEYLGIMDVVKAMLMWVETPEERVLKKRSLVVGK